MQRLFANKGGKGAESNMDNLLLIVVVLILVSQLAPTALSGFFNQNQNGSLTCSVFNSTSGLCQTPTLVPNWVPGTLGILAVIAFIYLIWRLAKGGK